MEHLEYYYEWRDENNVYHSVYAGTKLTSTTRPDRVPKNADLRLTLVVKNPNSFSADVQCDVYMDGKIFFRKNITQVGSQRISAASMEATFGSHEYSIYLNKQLVATVMLEQTIYSPPPISRNMYLGGKTYEIGSCTLGDLIAGGWQYGNPYEYNKIPSTIKPLEEIGEIVLEMDREVLYVTVTNLEAESCILRDCVVVGARSHHTGDAYAGAVIGQRYNPWSGFFNRPWTHKGEDGYCAYWGNGFFIMLDVDDSQNIYEICMRTPLSLL